MNKKGFTLIEMLLALLICSVCTLLYSTFAYNMKGNDYPLYTSDDEIHIHQMRMLFALSKEIQLEGDMLAIHYLQKDLYFVFMDNKLVLQEGYQVFLMDVDDVYFKRRKGCYHLIYKRENKTYERVIGCE